MNALVQSQPATWEVVPEDKPLPALMDKLDQIVALPGKTHAQFTAGLSYADGYIALLRRRATESKEIALMRKEAERKRFVLQEGLGQLLLAAPKAPGAKGRFAKAAAGGTHEEQPAATGGSHEEQPVEAPPTLADLGISRKESSKAQKIAKLPEEVKKQVLDGEITVNAALAAEAPPKPPKAEREATALEKAKERIQELEDLLEVKEIDLQEAQDKAERISEELQGYVAIAAGEEAKALAVERGKRQAAESKSNALQNENNELKREVASLQRRLRV